MAATLWIDVEDLFEYARTNRRPSGIQRLAFEIYRTMQAQYADTGLVQFVRHDSVRNSFRVVPWQDIADCSSVSRNPRSRRLSLRQAFLHLTRRRVGCLRRLVHRLPPALRLAVIDLLLAQAEALRAWCQLAEVLWKGGRRRLQPPAVPQPRPAGDRKTTTPTNSKEGDHSFADRAARGDILLVLGSPWSHPGYAQLVQRQRERGLRFALLVYDLIPIRRPEWCERGLVRLFNAWFQDVLPLCDTVFAISQATAADVEAYARESGVVLPGPVRAIPIGTGFSCVPQPPAAAHSRPLPSPASYVLFVSTIEARKNHSLAFRVWRRLLEDLPADRVPTLVFAGRIGWLVDDLIRQIANTNHLNGKLVLIENPTDAELTTLYRGCLFTLLPSFHEGWGLPVTESLAFGKPCIISNRTALPEAGGRLARSFDPDNLHDAYEVIRRTIEDRSGLTQWEAEVRRDFKPVPWSATVQVILDGLSDPFDGCAVTADITGAERASGRILAENAAAGRL